MVEYYGTWEDECLVDYVRIWEENRKEVLRPSFQLFPGTQLPAFAHS